MFDYLPGDAVTSDDVTPKMELDHLVSSLSFRVSIRLMTLYCILYDCIVYYDYIMMI